MTPHPAWFAACLAGFRHVKVNRDATVFVRLYGDRFDAVGPTLQGGFVKVARSVIGVDACGVENLRAEVVAQTGKTPLVEHERSALLSVDALGFQMGEEVVCRDVFVQHVGSESSEERMGIFLGRWNEDDVGGGPQPHSVFVGENSLLGIDLSEGRWS